MEQMKDGGPAFPVSTGDAAAGHQDGHTTWQFPGMTLRDYFAAKALQGMSAISLADGEMIMGWADMSTAAYKAADAMLKARTGSAA
ncbi:MAG: hypothetical protein EOO27_46350 [Comamonadaceae bacterium]|nr:MAG: hypothetical protein EOO27_46350 [Comamonadaceae bacterium]